MKVKPGFTGWRSSGGGFIEQTAKFVRAHRAAAVGCEFTNTSSHAAGGIDRNLHALRIQRGGHGGTTRVAAKNKSRTFTPDEQGRIHLVASLVTQLA